MSLPPGTVIPCSKDDLAKAQPCSKGCGVTKPTCKEARAGVPCLSKCPKCLRDFLTSQSCQVNGQACGGNSDCESGKCTQGKCVKNNADSKRILLIVLIVIAFLLLAFVIYKLVKSHRR